jgi:hypothetical protein
VNPCRHGSLRLWISFANSAGLLDASLATPSEMANRWVGYLEG